MQAAYGRVYKSIDAAKADWKKGLDFKIHNGPYCSIRDKDVLEKDYGPIYFYINGDLERLDV